MQIKLYRSWYYAVWRTPTGTKRLALRTQDHSEALRALTDLQSPTPSTSTISGLWASYVAARPTTRASECWVRLSPFWGHLRPDQVDRPLCRSYTTSRRAAGVGDGTIHTELTYLRAALRLHSRSLSDQMELPSKPAPRTHFLTRPQYAQLLSAAHTPHTRLFITLALSTAGRMTAILELTWDRIDFDRGLISLGTGERRKKGRATVPMTDTARVALVAAHATRTTPYVIEYAGAPILKIRKAFARTAERAGLPWVTPHVLRHTAAVWLAEAGVPIPEIAQYMGHEDSRITERVYSRYSPEYLRKAASALEHS